MVHSNASKDQAVDNPCNMIELRGICGKGRELTHLKSFKCSVVGVGRGADEIPSVLVKQNCQQTKSFWSPGKEHCAIIILSVFSDPNWLPQKGNVFIYITLKPRIKLDSDRLYPGPGSPLFSLCFCCPNVATTLASPPWQEDGCSSSRFKFNRNGSRSSCESFCL